MLNDDTSNTNALPQWYCIRSKVKQEHIAAGHLKLLPEIDVYCPRLKIRRLTSRGPAWFTEALFPGYFFGKFEAGLSLRKISHSPGVFGVVRFGNEPAVLPESAIQELMTRISDENPHIIPEAEISPGDEVVIVEGAYQGLHTVVTRLMPAKDRVKVLLEVLGQNREAIISRDHLFKESVHCMDPFAEADPPPSVPQNSSLQQT